ncbi:MAG TPA: hypothetical protein PKM88_06010, partial [bacterium]|nr:hypothetical protein [bacterium]
RLLAAFGPQHWWPGETRWEIMLGAILTQNTAWTNVEQAIGNLKRAQALPLAAVRALPDAVLARHIRPSGYFNQKVKKIRALLRWLDGEHGGSLARAARVPTERLRAELLGIWGIGPETADSMLLYAFNRPVFVVDAYTRRILPRCGLFPAAWEYAQVQAYCVAHAPAGVPCYNEFHALLVMLGKQFCKPRPRCAGCPLQTRCATGQKRKCP